jgi:hypothetical protein
MAIGMKWPALVLAGCLLTTAWARTIPVDEAERPRRAHVMDADLALLQDMRANLTALRDADRSYRQLARVDSLLPLLTSSSGMVVGLPQTMPGANRDTVQAYIARELAAIGEPRARVGVFFVDNAYGHRPGTPLGRPRPEHELYVGVDSAGAFCARVRTAPVGSTIGMVLNNVQLNPSVGASALGACAFVARYGAPGSDIFRWLRGGGYRLADRRGDVPNPVGEPSLAFQSELTVWSESDRALRACIAGREGRCDDILLMSADASRNVDGSVVLDLPGRFQPGGIDSRALLHHLEQEFGASRFETFWTSNADVSTAFASAFGVDAGDWIRDWGRSRYGQAQLGPRVDAVTLLLSALLAAGFAAAAVLIERRRSL